MSKEKLNELMQLYLFGELEEAEQKKIEEILKNSPEAAEEFESTKSLFKTFSSNKPGKIKEEVLLEARRELIRNINNAKNKPAFFENLFAIIQSAQLTGYKLAAGGVFFLAIGILSGYLLFSVSISEIADKKNKVVNIDEVLSSGANLANFRLSDTYAPDGKITITFEAAQPYKYTGEIEDLTVQKLMANLITNSENPGFKIKTVNTIAERVNKNFIPDKDVKNALIISLKSDDNVGVRRAAMDVLIKYPFDTEIRDALLFVLAHDTNPGQRISAVNLLAGVISDGAKMDSSVKKVLDKKVKTEPNLFVKKMAESLLEGEELR
ncbi:MAG: hypothetical protein CVV23_01730 [Ignavibacteriae bacterium HGW-Ignavibacteriae-2]|jgi:hypothetical protein|nr:MAG: hypothetical protein CVV23_01730 [Ignavibacteriae bacterium HGW-Ignavibacteriae-2]